VHVVYVEWRLEIWPGTGLEPGHPSSATLEAERFNGCGKPRRDSHAEKTFTRIEIAMRKSVSNNARGLWTHLLGTHDVRIGVLDHPAKIARDSAIDEEIDRQDSE
jgi:hypothetical protein